MATYLVTWEIDFDADNPIEAAEKALEIQRRVGSSAVVFDVTNAAGVKVTVDLDVVTSDARKICRAFDAADERDSTEIGV